ncbi:response regulator transcription factor [Nocardioides sp. T2.26MG-1]|uniref:response regulator transcription factor n=1 Tax=Nocardioides sp. T2.26MG-1 TaxID=3041166 RepID=UPI0024779CFA|nr:response regulator transcription factor [Nocardioides sp. T2.26MG-1]CAI9398595.1 Transcriptional regulatory protein DegU [Nocardioides sp. T2.26MG-1]
MGTSTAPSHPQARSRTRILILEDHALFAESLELALSMEGYDVRRAPVPQSSGATQGVLSTVLRLHPRICLLDLDLGAFGDGRRLIAPMAHAGAHVVVVTASTDRGRWGECLSSGARKVLSKSRPLNDILVTVRRLNQGQPVLDPGEREELLRASHERREEAQLGERLTHLTSREQTILGQLMLGRTVREIAAASVVSEATVRTQVKSILAKLEVSSQLAAVGLAHRSGWRPPAS